METDRLKQFRAVVDSGNLRKAAELLGISHGGLSKSLKTLADEVGTPLFHQRGRTLELTREGKALYSKISPVLDAVEQLLSTSKSGSQSVPTLGPLLRIGTFEVFSSHFISRLLDEGFRDYRLQIHELIPGEMEKELLEDRVDFGITYAPVPRAGIHFEKILRIRMGIFGRKGSFSGRATDQLPFAVPIPPIHGSPTGIRGLDGWPDHLFPRKVVFEMDLMETALELCRAGLAVAFLPCFVVRHHNDTVKPDRSLVEFSLPKAVAPVYRDVYLARRSALEETREERKLAKALRMGCKEG